MLGTARHSETLEEVVVYRQEYGERGLWVRPKPMFQETVTVEGQEKARFAPLASDGEPMGSKPMGSEPVGREVANLFADLPPSLPQEVLQTLLQAAHVRIERILSHGHASAADFWYDQPQHEWVLVLQGAARLQFEDGLLDMKPGDFVNIPAFCKHRVDWTTPDGPTVWLGVYYG